MAALDGFPGAMLGSAEGGFFLGQPADGGRIDEHLCAAESHQPSGFGIPLVPTNEHPDFPKARVPHWPAAVSGSEIELLLEAGILRDVALSIEPHQRAVRIVDGGGVVIETRAAVFEQRGN